MSGVVPKISLGDLSQFRVAIISASWHEQICADLIAGARRALLEAKLSQSRLFSSQDHLNYH